MNADAHSGLLILSRSDISRLMSYADYVDAVEAGFRAAATGKALAPPAAAFHVPGGSYHAKAAALLAGYPPMMAIKLNGNYPGNPCHQWLTNRTGRDLTSPMRPTGGRWR